MDIRLDPAALDDVQTAYDFYESRQEGLGDAFEQALRQRLREIAGTPRRYPAISPGIHKARLLGYPYSIYFSARPSFLLIVAVHHHSRHDDRWKSRVGLAEAQQTFVAMTLSEQISSHHASVSSIGGKPTIELPAAFNVAVPFIDRHIAEGRGGKVAIRTLGEDVTYAELAERVNRAGNALLALGLKPGDRLLMVVKDSPAFFYLFWGAIKMGVVPVPPNTLLRAADYAYMFEDSGCGLVVYSQEFAGEIEPALKQVPVKALTVDAFGETMAGASAQLEARLAAPTDDCFWLYSSGSTGRPKGAVHLQRDMVVTSELYGVRVLGVRDGDVSFSAAKLFFAYGLGNGMTFPLWTGGTAILDDRRPTPDTTFEIIERFKPTLYYGVPALYAAQLVALDKGRRDLSSIRACVSAGEALPAEIFRRWQEKTGTIILDGIGSTEALHIFIANSLADYRPGTSGKPVPGYEARILDEHRNPVPQGESGRLWIRADSAAKYYWNKPEKTAETMVEGWLNTGDTYRQDADGYYIYDGRSDDMLKVGGIWCSPVEIENCLIGHQAVLEAAIVGQVDENELVKPKAFVVLKPGQNAGEQLTAELMSLCRSTLAPYKYPRWVEFVPELPKTATGKIQRFKLRA